MPFACGSCQCTFLQSAAVSIRLPTLFLCAEVTGYENCEGTLVLYVSDEKCGKR